MVQQHFGTGTVVARVGGSDLVTLVRVYQVVHRTSDKSPYPLLSCLNELTLSALRIPGAGSGEATEWNAIVGRCSLEEIS